MGQNSRQGSRMKDVTCAHQSTGSTVTWGIVVEVTFPGGRDVSEGKDPRGSWGWGASSCLTAGRGGAAVAPAFTSTPAGQCVWLELRSP